MCKKLLWNSCIAFTDCVSRIKDTRWSFVCFGCGVPCRTKRFLPRNRAATRPSIPRKLVNAWGRRTNSLQATRILCGAGKSSRYVLFPVNRAGDKPPRYTEWDRNLSVNPAKACPRVGRRISFLQATCILCGAGKSSRYIPLPVNRAGDKPPRYFNATAFGTGPAPQSGEHITSSYL